MATTLPPLSWTCSQCGQQVPAGGQTTCPNPLCAGGTSQPQPPAPQSQSRPRRQSAQLPAGSICPHCGAVQPLPGLAFCTACGRPLAAARPQQPVPPAAPRAPRRAPANPPPAAQPPVHYGSGVQYIHPVRATRGRDEHWLSRWLFLTLLGLAIVGGLALLAWLMYGGFLLGWHANPCKPPCVAAIAVPSSTAPARAAKPTPATKKAVRSRPAVSAAPRQVQVSGSLDLVHHDAQTQAATPALRDLEGQEANFWRWAEGRNQ